MPYKHFNNAAKIIEHFQRSVASLRSNRINASLLDDIFAEMYGQKTPIKQLATITNPEPMQLLITTFDKSSNKAICKAISDSNLGVNPNDDGAGVRLNFPPLTEQARKDKVKLLHSLLEKEGKIPVRNERQNLMQEVKKMEEDGEISKDDRKKMENEIQKEHDTLISEIESMSKQKEEEIMKI